jgi:hypothetical protein
MIIVGSTSTTTIVVRLTSVPDHTHAAILSLMWTICGDYELSWHEERAFLVHIFALEAQHIVVVGIWLCADSVIFHCEPSLHYVSMSYPEALLDYMLMRLVHF